MLADGNRILVAAPLMTSTFTLLGIELRRIQSLAQAESDYQSFLLTARNSQHAAMLIDYAARTVANWHLMELNRVPEHFVTAQLLRMTAGGPLKL